MKEKKKIEYADFDLSIETEIEGKYPVKVRSPAGELSASFSLPFDEAQLKVTLDQLQNVLLGPHPRTRKIPTPEEKTVQQFGSDLFETLMNNEIRSAFELSRREVERDGKGLRLKLRIAPPALMSLPWEYLYDQRTDQYLGLSVHTPIVRYVELPKPADPMFVIPPLRILVMIANPQGYIPLDVAHEQELIEKALDELIRDRQIEVVWLSPPTWRTLQRYLRSAEYHIFHFIGHGDFDETRQEGTLLFEDEKGRAERMHAEKLARLLADHRTLRLALLNACESARTTDADPFSSTAASLVRARLPAVVAMQFEITDLAAIELARIFYESIADSLPVDAALAEARKGISLCLPNTFEWGVPVLYTHAPEGRIFEVSSDLTRSPLFADAEGRETEWSMLIRQELAQNKPSAELSERLSLLVEAQLSQARLASYSFMERCQQITRTLADLVPLVGDELAAEIIKEMLKNQELLPKKPQTDETLPEQ